MKKKAGDMGVGHNSRRLLVNLGGKKWGVLRQGAGLSSEAPSNQPGFIVIFRGDPTVIPFEGTLTDEELALYAKLMLTEVM